MDEQGDEVLSEDEKGRRWLNRKGHEPECAAAMDDVLAAWKRPAELDQFQSALAHAAACDRCARLILQGFTNGMFMANVLAATLLSATDPIHPRELNPPPERKRGRGKRARMPLRRSRR